APGDAHARRARAEPPGAADRARASGRGDPRDDAARAIEAVGRKRREPHSVESADGTRIGYTVSGAGPSLLLVHGTAVDSRSCILLGNVLAESRRVALMDRRGRGLAQDGGTYSRGREVEDVLAVVEALDPPVHVVGISYGGLPALEAAARSDRLAAVTLFEPPIRTGDYTFLTESGMAKLDRLIAAGRMDDA